MNSSDITASNQPKVSLSFGENPTNSALAPAHSRDDADPRQPDAFALQFAAGPLAPSQPAAGRKKRNGKIAQLPKPEREMVNLMLRDKKPYYIIESALADRGFVVSQRNISNWKTRGGYNEWCAAQAHAAELRLFQENLTGFLRHHDAAEVPEVGLQSAATNLSAILLRPDLMKELLADPDKYSRLIELQCRLAREIQALQKYRDEASTLVGGHPERLKREHEHAAEQTRKRLSAETDPYHGHLVLPDSFTHKELEPLKLFTPQEKAVARLFESFFKPVPENPLVRRKAEEDAAAAAANAAPASQDATQSATPQGTIQPKQPV